MIGSMDVVRLLYARRLVELYADAPHVCATKDDVLAVHWELFKVGLAHTTSVRVLYLQVHIVNMTLGMFQPMRRTRSRLGTWSLCGCFSIPSIPGTHRFLPLQLLVLVYVCLSSSHSGILL